ncbi:Neuropeptide-like peptide [Dirofilaria immitis]
MNRSHRMFKLNKGDQMPKQEFEFIDYLGPLAVSVCFVVVLFILSAIINFIWITKNDDRTVFEKFGSTFDLRCGVHRMRHRPNKSWKRVQLIDNQDI